MSKSTLEKRKLKGVKEFTQSQLDEIVQKNVARALAKQAKRI